MLIKLDCVCLRLDQVVAYADRLVTFQGPDEPGYLTVWLMPFAQDNVLSFKDEDGELHAKLSRSMERMCSPTVTQGR